MHQARITYYDSLLPGHITCEKPLPTALATGLLQEHGYSPRFDGADVFDHYDGTRVAVITNAWVPAANNEELYHD